MSDKLTDRLRGKYEVGPNGEFGTRDFSGFIPPISIEAADRIDELEEALRLIQSVGQLDSENPMAIIENICHEVIGEQSPTKED